MKDDQLASELRLHATYVEDRGGGPEDAGHQMRANQAAEGARLMRLASERIENGPTRVDGESVTLTVPRLYSLAYALAGATSTPFMRDHPGYVMPTEEIGTLVQGILTDYGFPDPPPGYTVADSIGGC